MGWIKDFSGGNRTRFQGWFLVCVLMLVVGIGLRGANLDHKVYWHDEVYTSFNISGYARSEVVAGLFQGDIVGVDDLQAYQQPTPARGIPDLLRAMGQEDNQHPPLYYILLRVWVDTFGNSFGNSIVAIRSLSVLFGVLVLPGLYWLCWELFQSHPICWTAIALVAVSPMHLLYAQEAREYSLWTALMLVASASFLRAMRSPSWKHWGLYGLSLGVSFYTFLFSGLVAIAHGLYILLNRQAFQGRSRWPFSPQATGYLAAFSSASLLLTPWLWMIVQYYEITQLTSGWTKIPIPRLTLIKIWAYNLTRLFVDFDFDPYRIESPSFYGVILAILALQLYAVYYLCRHAPQPVRLFLGLLILSTTALFMVQDLVLGGQRSVSSRYMIPSFVGIEIAVAYLLTQKIQAPQRVQRTGWSAVLTLLLVLNLMSCFTLLQSETWWAKSVSYDLPQIARLINQSDRPLVISDSYGINIANTIALSYRIKPETQFILLKEVGQGFTVPTLPPDQTTIFLYNLPEQFRLAIEENYGVQLNPLRDDLWQFKIPES